MAATGLTYPTSLAIAPDGTVFVGEAGFTYGPKEAVARVVTIGPGGAVREVARGLEGPLNGLALRDSELFVSHRGKVSVLTLEREADGGFGETGAFAPFGTTRETIEPGRAPSGTILRLDPETGAIAVYADGLRNPYSLAWSPGGSPYATNLGYDDRGGRAVRQGMSWTSASRDDRPGAQRAKKEALNEQPGPSKEDWVVVAATGANPGVLR